MIIIICSKREMAMLPPQEVSRCEYIVLMINNRHRAGLWDSNASFTALQHSRSNRFIQQFNQGWVQVLWYWTQSLFIVWWDTPSSSPAQVSQRLPRQPALTQMRNRERAFESCRTCGGMRKFLHSPCRNVSPVWAISRNRRLSLLSWSHTASRVLWSFPQVMLRQTEGLWHL